MHGIFDYIGAAVLLGVPFITDFQAAPPFAYWFSVAAGAGLFAYSLMTGYYFSVSKLISLKGYLILDTIAGVAFIIVSFLICLGDVPGIFFLVSGIGVIGLVLAAEPNVVSETREMIVENSVVDS